MKSWPCLLLVLSFGCYELPELEETGTETNPEKHGTDSETETGPDSETETGPDSETETGPDSETGKVCSDHIFCYEERPENSCVDDQKIRVYRVGTCDDKGGCVYPSDVHPCNGDGGCDSDKGICLDFLCQGVVCNKPPKPKCANDNLGLVHWTGEASCYPQTGTCIYGMTTSPCGSGTRCVNDMCEKAPCTGLQGYCDLQRPASYCDGDTLIEFKQPAGWCERGECVYGVCEEGEKCVPKEPTQAICEFGCAQGLCGEANTQGR